MIGTKLGSRYEIRRELGRGGMGVVYAAHDPVLSREVAVKLIPPVMLTPETEERFLREAQTVAQMDHPGIVPIHDLGRHVDGSLYFVMPVLPGRTLRQLLNGASLPLGDVLEIVAQAAEALDYSHERGVVHRDVKPENVMVARDGGLPRVRMMDFGLARGPGDARITRTGVAVGTMSYSSPEQVAGEAADARTDIWSLGTVLYECLAGDPPFHGHVQSVLHDIGHSDPPPLPASLGRELVDVVLSCLRRPRAERTQRARDLADALRRYGSRLGAEETSRVTVERPKVAEAASHAAPFVGREKELAELSRRLDASVLGECQLVLVGGEAGIGKSRLLLELKGQARARRVRVLRGLFAEQDRTFAYQGFCELVQDYFRGRDTRGSSATPPDLSDLAGDLLALFPVLSEIPEIRAAGGDSRVAMVGEPRREGDRTALFELLARTLGRLGGGRPMVLLLENLHGADVSLEALPYLARRLSLTPTLIVGTYRQTEVDRRHPLFKLVDSFADDPRFASLVLGPLAPSEHGALVKTLVGGREVSAAVSDRLLSASEGNPYFTQELVRSLLDSGAIVTGESGTATFAPGSGITADALPATIQQAVSKRVARLPAELREVLSTASVLGRAFAVFELEELVGELPGTPLDEAVERLLREGFLEEDSRSREDRLLFGSGVVRDVLYATLSRRKRRLLHRKAAELLERRHAGRLDRVYPQLVHHFSEGDVPEKTVEYGFLLARRHLAAFSPAEALRVLKDTREFLEDDDEPALRRASLEARLLTARAYRLAGDLESSLREVGAALARFSPEADGPELVLDALLLAGETAWQARRVEEAQGFADRGLPLARAGPDRDVHRRLLGLSLTAANLRGERGVAEERLAEIERLARDEASVRDEAPAGGTLVVALANEVLTRDPALAQTDEETEVLANVFETLVVADESGNLVPRLCEGFDLDDDGRTVTLRLRRDVLFSDGEPLTAEIALRSLERMQHLTPGSAGSVFAAALAGPITAPAPDLLRFRLREPLPIFPAFLTDPCTALAKPAADGSVVGTGPFRFEETADENRILLTRNPCHADEPARLAALDFRTAVPSVSIAAGFRAGDFDLVRDLLPQDLDDLLRDARVRSRLVEAPKKGTYFVQFATHSPSLSRPEVRRALAGVVRTQDLVWSTLGRFALPATSLLPPGILGHDAGRRPTHLSPGRAQELLRNAGFSGPVSLEAAVHPLLLDRYGALTEALLSAWRALGVSVKVVTTTLAEYVGVWNGGRVVDVLLGRWYVDYDDPDSFLYGLYHGTHGLLRDYFSSKDSDRYLEEARLERRPAVRESLYHDYEGQLLEEAVVLPLFHELDLRMTSPSVRGTALSSAPPFVNYARLGKAVSVPAAQAVRPSGGTVRVPVAGAVHELDPALTWTAEQSEVLPAVFETLTKDVGGRIVPFLAREVLVEDGGRSYRIRLRPGVRFHDGRPLTSRDVRYSFERLLGSDRSDHRELLLAPVRGARAVLAGREKTLEGVHIVSPTELVVRLTEPVSFFPALLSYPAAAILPEGTTTIGRTVKEGAVGTGAYRVTRFLPGERLELERNAAYWRDGIPKNDALIFRFGLSPQEIREEFVAGRLSIASDLFPADAEAFRADPALAAGYRESPRLSTYFIILNRSRGPLADEAVRRAVYERIRPAVASLVTRTLGRQAVPARGLIPPGLLGAVPAEDSPARPSASRAAPSPSLPKELTAALHPIFYGEYGVLFQELLAVFQAADVRVTLVNRTMAELSEFRQTAGSDLVFARWVADFPDPDTFLHGVLHKEGSWGRYVSDPALDALAARGRVEMESQARDAIYRQAEELLARDALVVPLFHEQVYRFARPEVDGLSVGLGRPAVAYEELLVRRSATL